MENKEIFKKRLQEQRLANKLSYQKLGDELHLSNVAILKWEKGLAEPSLSNFIQLCKVLDISADYLLGLTDNM
ncbi:MAG: helix-turn-helix domain-containing protein [Firmicutes bacterium]|nr:helix-turn-helix domain-containing protein [Bacillota bacterium]MCM1393370.1 helix-turn-helix domain-containing protein [[Eubacterium] siraeum]